MNEDDEQNKIYISVDMGCAYRLNDGILEFSPFSTTGSSSNFILDNSDWNAVEPELVGEESVLFKGVDTNLYGVFKTVKRELEK